MVRYEYRRTIPKSVPEVGRLAISRSRGVCSASGGGPSSLSVGRSPGQTSLQRRDRGLVFLRWELIHIFTFGGSVRRLRRGLNTSFCRAYILAQANGASLAGLGQLHFDVDLVSLRQRGGNQMKWPNQASAGDCAVTFGLQIERPSRAAPDRQR